MGNRAVIVRRCDVLPGMITDGIEPLGRTIKEDALGVYLHWCGGLNDVTAFLTYCKAAGYRKPEDDCYGWAYLCKVIGNYFNDGLSLGIDLASHLDCNNGDNGTYLMEDWEVVGKLYTLEDDDIDKEYIKKKLLAIDRCQPVQLGETKLFTCLEEVLDPLPFH